MDTLVEHMCTKMRKERRKRALDYLDPSWAIEDMFLKLSPEPY